MRPGLNSPCSVTPRRREARSPAALRLRGLENRPDRMPAVGASVHSVRSRDLAHDEQSAAALRERPRVLPLQLALGSLVRYRDPHPGSPGRDLDAEHSALRAGSGMQKRVVRELGHDQRGIVLIPRACEQSPREVPRLPNLFGPPREHGENTACQRRSPWACTHFSSSTPGTSAVSLISVLPEVRASRTQATRAVLEEAAVQRAEPGAARSAGPAAATGARSSPAPASAARPTGRPALPTAAGTECPTRRSSAC